MSVFHQSFDRRKEKDNLYSLLNSQAILTHLARFCACVCLKDVYIVNNHLIKMVRLHHEQPFPSFSSAQHNKGGKGKVSDDWDFSFCIFSEEKSERFFFSSICVKLMREKRIEYVL